jgi:hypothetical protein
MTALPDLPRIIRTDAEPDTDTDTDTTADSSARIVHLPLLCFNDVYRVSQRYVPQPGAPKIQPGTEPDAQITVAQFGQLLLSERDKWADKLPRADDTSSLSASVTATSASESEGYSSVTISDIDSASCSQASESRGDTPVPSGSEQTTDESKDKDQGKGKEGLVLFAGDVFNPSVESAVTRGSHMVSDPAPLTRHFVFTISGRSVL